MVSKYDVAIQPHILWFKEQIEKSKNGTIRLMLKDIKKELGNEFVDKHDVSVYSRIRDILLKSGIKVNMEHDNNGNKILKMMNANENEIMSSTEIRRVRAHKTTENAGFDNHADYQRDYKHKNLIQQSESENIDCPRYFGEYIEEKYVSQIFEDSIPVPIGQRCGRGIEKKYDFECKNGYKIKHIASCMRTRESHKSRITGEYLPYWEWLIRNNNVPDYFILSAWDNRGSLEPLYVWIIKGNEEFVTQVSNKPFWDRATWAVYCTKKGIDRMSKYDFTNKLNELKEICKLARKEE